MSFIATDNLDVETVIQKIEETNTCANLDPPFMSTSTRKDGSGSCV